MPLWLFITIAAVLFLGAIALLYWGLWGDRSKGRFRRYIFNTLTVVSLLGFPL